MSGVAHWRSMMDSSEWLTAADLTKPDGTTRDTLVTIEKVEQGEVRNASGKARKPVVHFQGHKKPLALNVTNCRSLFRLHGTNKPSEWVGKQCVLFVGQATVQGEDVPAIRIRPSLPPARGGRGAPPPVEEQGREPGAEG